MKSTHLTKNFLLTTLAALLLSIPASAATVLKYSDHEPLGGMRTRFLKDVFFPAIEKESKGRLKIEDHWNGELAISYEALLAVSEKGTADMTTAVPEYTAKELPLHQIFKSFPVGPTGDKQVAFFRRVYAEIPAFTEEWDKNNVVNIFSATGYPVAFFSNKPLNTLEDIKGEKWRTASFWHNDFLRNAGATPISMPWGEEIFKSLQAGTLDGLMVNVDGGYMLKVHEVAPNVLVSKNFWMGHLYPVVMNKQTWNKLDKRDKRAIQRAAQTAYQSLGSVMDSSMHEQVEDLKKAGAQVRILKPEERKRWEATSEYRKLQASWVKEQEGKGVKDAGIVVEKVNAIMADVMKPTK